MKKLLISTALVIATSSAFLQLIAEPAYADGNEIVLPIVPNPVPPSPTILDVILSSPVLPDVIGGGPGVPGSPGVTITIKTE